MKITVVMDNNVPFNLRRPLVAEHGISFLVDVGEQRILYDTGQTGAVVSNLTTLGIPPSTLTGIVLSHGHYDHTGGLLAVLRAASNNIPVTIHTRAFVDRYSVTPALRSPVGIPFAENYLKSIGGDWRPTDIPTELADGLWFSGTIPRVTDFEVVDVRLKLAAAAGDEPDPMNDDSVLYFVGNHGLVVVGGCTHSGLVNAVLHGFTVTGANRLQGWIGGTHLGPATKDQQDRTIARLVEWNPDFVAVSLAA